MYVYNTDDLHMYVHVYVHVYVQVYVQMSTLVNSDIKTYAYQLFKIT
jgi:hypothetical protein